MVSLALVCPNAVQSHLPQVPVQDIAKAPCSCSSCSSCLPQVPAARPNGVDEGPLAPFGTVLTVGCWCWLQQTRAGDWWQPWPISTCHSRADGLSNRHVQSCLSDRLEHATCIICKQFAAAHGTFFQSGHFTRTLRKARRRNVASLLDGQDIFGRSKLHTASRGVPQSSTGLPQQHRCATAHSPPITQWR